jgi:type IV pilus assembly protein PilE
MKMNKLSNAGFTLIEIMVVVAIIGIVAGIALPSYLNSLNSSRRTDAMGELTQAAALQERWYFTYNQYNGDIGNLMAGVDAATWLTSDGFYSLSVNTTAGECGTAGTCFLLTATAAGSQTNDTDCLTFTLSSNGTQTGCWRN